MGVENKYEVVNPFFHHTKNFTTGSQIILSAQEAKGYGESVRPWPADKPDPEPPKDIAPSVYVSPKDETGAKITSLQEEIKSCNEEIAKLQEANGKLNDTVSDKDKEIESLKTSLNTANEEIAKLQEAKPDEKKGEDKKSKK
ncbi:MAG: hypothetical protein UZ05_CHB002000268 [Chlorobi bacterium OLB5]|nr:MAG: hypothetical protein UZ05_CHB002000268 [Chlorobi bacterium OLB5]